MQARNEETERGNKVVRASSPLWNLWAEGDTVPRYVRVASEDDRRKIGVVVTSYGIERVSDVRTGEARERERETNGKRRLSRNLA